MATRLNFDFFLPQRDPNGALKWQDRIDKNFGRVDARGISIESRRNRNLVVVGDQPPVPSHQTAPILNPDLHRLHAIDIETRANVENFSQSLQDAETLIRHLNDPEKSIDEIFLRLRLLPQAQYLQICSLVARAFSLRSEGSAAEALQSNPLVLLRIKDENGLNPIEQLRDQLKTKLDQSRAILQLVELETYAITSLSDARTFSAVRQINDRAIEMFQALSPLAKDLFCYHIWNLNERPSVENFGMNHVMETHDVNMFREYRGVKITDRIIHQLQDSSRNALRFNVQHVHSQEIQRSDSEHVKATVFQLYQLQDFINILQDPVKNSDNAFLSHKFDQLDASLRETLKGLIWIGMHQNGHGGSLDASSAPLDFNAILAAQDQTGRPLLEGILHSLTQKVAAQRKLDELAPLWFLLRQQDPAAERHLIMEAFRRLPSSVQTHLEYRLWYVSGGKDNSSFGGPNWGEREIASNPHSLLPILFTETSSLIDKASYSIQSGLVRPWLNLQKAKAVEPSALPATVHQPIDMLRFSAATVKTALTAPPRMFAERLPVPSADRPYMDHEIRSIAQNEDAQALSRKVAGLFPLFKDPVSRPALAERNITTAQWGVFEDSAIPEWNFQIAERRLSPGESREQIQKYSDVLHTVIEKEGLQITLPQACAIPLADQNDEATQRQIAILSPLWNAMRQEPHVANEELLRLFSRIDPATRDRLLGRLWYESGGKTNSHFGGLGWGERTVQNNPRCLMPFLQAEIEHLRNPTVFVMIDQKQAGTDFRTGFYQLSAEQQRRCAEDFCRFIALTGYDQVSLDHMSIVDGKIKLHNLPLYSADNIPNARANARNALNWLAQQCYNDAFPILRIAAEQQIAMLAESDIDSPQTIQLYRAFAKLMKDPSASTEQKQVAFQRLPIEVRHFLHFCVWSGIKDIDGTEDRTIGRKRLEADINILTQLQNSSGMNILEQFEVRYSLTEVLNILRLTKRMLSQENARPETLHLFVDTLEKTLLGSAMLSPIAQHLTQKIESIQSTHAHLSDEDLFEEIKTALVGSPGQDGILDFYIRSIDATKRELSIPAIDHRVKMNREFDPEHFPVRPTQRDQIQITTPPKPLEELPQGMRVLVVAYECAQYGLKYGGLGEAVYGIAKSLKNRGCEVTLLMPKFSGLPQPLRERIEREGTPSTVRHEVSGTMKEDRVLTIQQDGITLAYLEDTSAERNRFDVPGGPQIYEDGVLAVPGKEWHGLKERMAYVGSATAEYIVANKDQFDAVVYNDWHAAYAVDRIAHRYFDRWTCGEFPANVFIIHNNSYGCQGVYGVEEADALHMFGDQRKGLNVMAEVVELAERSSTVSETFAQEMQDGGLTAGIGPWVRKSAHDDKFKGIINGSNPDLWNPSTNPVLKNWRDPVTGDAIDLSFSPQTPDLVAHKRLVREQLYKALQVHYPEALAAMNYHSADDMINNPLLLYVGRYDQSQKGIDKLVDIMEAVHAKGGRFISMGAGEINGASEVLDALEQRARELNCAWITRGTNNASLKMQLGDGGKPALGALIRAAADFCCVPSSFEPCGLVQTEGWLFGAPAIGTRTGGLADTIISDQAHPRFNGFTYDRLHDWKSPEQKRLVRETTTQALDYWEHLSNPDKHAMMSRLMTDGRQLSWTTSPNGISPSDRYITLLQEAIAAKKTRHTQKTDLLGIEDKPATVTDHHFGFGQQTQLYNSFGAHIESDGVNFRVMAPAAQAVRVITVELSEMNEPTGKETAYEMQKLPDGSWQTKIGSAKEGTRYQYEIVNAQGEIVRKTDPFALGFDPKDRKICTVTASPKDYAWNDGAWMADRPNLKDRPKNIYEVHVPSWFKQDGKFVPYQEIARRLAVHCQEMGFTHVELFGMFEHFVDESMGYQVAGYFAPTSRNGSLKDFQEFVDILHQNGIAVIMDFVPAHFVKDDCSLRDFDGTHFFETPDTRNRDSTWGTYTFNFDREDVRNFLLSSAHFFLEECHMDGIRADAVAHFIAYSRWRPKDSWNPGPDGTEWNHNGIKFTRDMNRMARDMHALTISENSWTQGYSDTLREDDPSGKGLGFDLRFNMEARHGAFDYFRLTAQERSEPGKRDLLRRKLTDCGNQSYIGPYMCHDETKAADRGHIIHHVTSSDDSTEDVKEKVRLYYAMNAFAPQHARMTATGMEFGLDGHFDPIDGLDWDRVSRPEHQSFKDLYARINRFYLRTPAFWEAGENLSRFNWVPLWTPDAVIAYERIDPSNPNKRYLVVHNFANKQFENFVIRDREQEAIRDIKQAKIVFRSDEADESRLGDARLHERHGSNYRKGMVIPHLPKYGTVVIEQTV